MITVTLIDHPFAPCEPKRFPAESLAQWLLSYYGSRLNVGLRIFAGQPCKENEIEKTPQAILQAEGSEFTVLQTPGGDPGTIFIGVVLSLASTMLQPDPDMPANVNRTQESPNNSLSSRDNQARILQRIEDIYGIVLAVPSTIMATYNKYISDEQIEYGYYCVGRGYYDISDLRDGDTPIQYIREAGAKVYGPFTSPNSGSPQLVVGEDITDPIVNVARSVEVNGITLLAQNQIQLSPNALYILARPGSARSISSVIAPGGTYAIPASSYNQIIQLQARPNIGSISEIGQTVNISGAPDTETASRTGLVSVFDEEYSNGTGMFAGLRAGDTVVFGGFTEPENNGTFTVATNSGGLLTTVEGGQVNELAGPTITADLTFDRSGYNGTFTIRSVEDQRLVLENADWLDDRLFEVDSPVTITVNNDLSDWTDWFTLPAADRDRVWLNFACQNGLYAENGGKFPVTVTYEAQLEQLTSLGAPTGTVETFSSSMTGATTAQKAETVEHSSGWTGPARIRARRTSPFLYDWQGTLIDEVKWIDLYSVSPVNQPDFGDITTIHTRTQATNRATSVRNRQLNCIAARKIPTWTGSGFSGAFNAEGRLVSGTITATNYLRDVFAAVALDPIFGRRTINDLDMVQISATAAEVAAMNEDASTFNYTFDSEQISFEEAANIIAEACFCRAYRQNGKLRLSFETTRDAPVSTLTHANKKPDAETVTRVFASESEYDGVELVYQDPVSRQAETIRLPLDGSYTNLKKVERPGIRSFEQAWLHANRDYNKLRYQRLSVETEVTTDARAFIPLSRVDIVDNTAFQAHGGQVIGQDGTTLTLDCNVEFAPGEGHSILLLHRDGSVESIDVEEGAQPNQVVLQSIPSESIVTTPIPEVGIRTSFSFASDSARDAQQWLLQEITPTDDPSYWRVSAINYTPLYYQADTGEIPARESVIE